MTESTDTLKFNINSIELLLVKCPSGIFTMGSPSGETGRLDDEIQHQVTISKDFYIGKYPVTQSLYESVMGNNPSHFKGAENPVERINWAQAQRFCDKLNQITTSERLPFSTSWNRKAERFRFYSGFSRCLSL